MDEVHEPGPTPAVRLIFEFDGDEVRLVSQQPVDVAVPGFDLARVLHPGHYVETRDADNAPLSRVSIREAFAASAEVFPEDHGEPITRVDVAEPKGAFTVIVPASAAATQVALLHVRPPAEVHAERPLGGATSATPAQPEVSEIATFNLAVERGEEETP
jgi:hypothetical protein